MRDKLNCPNCGAPITEERCPYCGTLFYDFVNIDPKNPIYLRIKLQDGSIVVCKANLNTLTLTHQNDCFYASAGLRNDHVSRISMIPATQIELKLDIIPDKNDEVYTLYKTEKEGK